MRSIKKLTATLLLASLVVATAGWQGGCGDKTPDQKKAEFVAYAKDINTAFISAGPLIAQLKPELKPKWDKGTRIAGQVLVAVEAVNETEVTRLIIELIPIFTEVAAEFTDNTRVLVILALADIGLRVFANHYRPDSSVSSGRPSAAGNVTAAKMRAFKNRPKWRCRDSVSGQFKKMDYCRQFPERSQVETR